jgi:cytochrome c oxidase subunit II
VKKLRYSMAPWLLGGAAAMTYAGQALASNVNMPRGVTDISQSIYNLHMLILWICVIIGIGVFGVIFWSLIHHRKALGAKPASFHESTRLEIAWTLIPTLILVGMAWPATKVLIEMYDTGGEDMTVEVRGYQWRWQYKYLDDDFNSTFGFFSTLATPRDEIENRSAKGEHYLLEVDNPLRIPVNRKVRFLLTSEDVIHAWWVPDFGLKKDAIPGMLNELWTIVNEPGVYRGMCTELCGRDHAFMPIVVHAMPEAEYDAWYAEQLVVEERRQEALSKTFTPEELMAQGQQVYNAFCAACHQANGQGIPPVFPGLVGTPVVTGPKEEHIRIIVEGVPGTSMQAFGRQLDAAQIAAVTHYERHSWGNNAGDITQPADVVAVQEGTAEAE